MYFGPTPTAILLAVSCQAPKKEEKGSGSRSGCTSPEKECSKSRSGCKSLDEEGSGGRSGCTSSDEEGFGNRSSCTSPEVECINSQVVQPFDPDKFNFKKALQKEVLYQVVSGEEDSYVPGAAAGEDPNLVFINISPIDYGHVLLVPRVMSCIPQASFTLEPCRFLFCCCCGCCCGCCC
jgi:hypothetical protein